MQERTYLFQQDPAGTGTQTAVQEPGYLRSAGARQARNHQVYFPPGLLQGIGWACPALQEGRVMSAQRTVADKSPGKSEMPDNRVNILLVDDKPENLLALEAILGDLGQNLVRARSGPEALRHVLKQDFAVILI